VSGVTIDRTGAAHRGKGTSDGGQFTEHRRSKPASKLTAPARGAFGDEWPDPAPSYGIEFAPRGTEVEPSTEATAIADGFVARAAAAKSTILGDVMMAALGAGAHLERIETDLKTVRSMARKIDSDAREKEISRGDAARRINDVVRYTAVLPTESYLDGATTLLDDLQRRGYTLIKDSGENWRMNYFGRNVQLRAPGGNGAGQSFEVQFHTAASLGAATVSHPAYEEARRDDTPIERKAFLNAAMVTFFDANVAVPPGVSVQ